MKQYELTYRTGAALYTEEFSADNVEIGNNLVYFYFKGNVVFVASVYSLCFYKVK